MLGHCIALYGYRAWVKDESSRVSGGEQKENRKVRREQSSKKRKRKEEEEEEEEEVKIQSDEILWVTSPLLLCLLSSIRLMCNASHHCHPL